MLSSKAPCERCWSEASSEELVSEEKRRRASKEVVEQHHQECKAITLDPI